LSTKAKADKEKNMKSVGSYKN